MQSLLFDRKISDYDITEWTKARNFKGVNAKGGKTFSFKLQLDEKFFCNVAEVYVETFFGPYPNKSSYALMCNKYGYLNEDEMKMLGKSFYWEDKRVAKTSFKSDKFK